MTQTERDYRAGFEWYQSFGTQPDFPQTDAFWNGYDAAMRIADAENVEGTATAAA